MKAYVKAFIMVPALLLQGMTAAYAYSLDLTDQQREILLAVARADALSRDCPSFRYFLDPDAAAQHLSAAGFNWIPGTQPEQDASIYSYVQGAADQIVRDLNIVSDDPIRCLDVYKEFGDSGSTLRGLLFIGEAPQAPPLR